METGKLEMKQLFENAISIIEELILIRTKQIEILSQLEKTKDATALQFKIKYYKIWINLLRTNINKCCEVKSKKDILELKLTKKLEEKLIELYESTNLKYLEDAKNDLLELEQLRRNQDDQSDSLFNSINSVISQDSNTEILVSNDNIKMITKIENMGSSSQKNMTGVMGVMGVMGANNIDTSKIEAQPKILSEESRPNDPRGAAIFDLRYIYGIGPKNAEKLVDSGITLERLLEDWSIWIKQDKNNAIVMPSKMALPSELSKRQYESLTPEKQHSLQMAKLNKRLDNETKYLAKLNSHQLLGVKYFHDMSQKIPRDEVQRAERILTAAAAHMNPDLQITLCGSFRRGRIKSGDIDCLITHPQITSMEKLDTHPVNILSKFVELLTNLDFLIDHLTDYGRSKYMGFCIVKQQGKKTNIARRIDIRFIPYNSYGAAILYFTGSKNFNTQMRTWALGKGYSLNEYGLKKIKDNILTTCQTEEEVFEILAYPYKKPEERDI